jgi:hypothetical protein
MRDLAATALGSAGNADDLAMLDDLAANDPTASTSHVTGETYFPVRAAAKSAADTIRKRLASKQPR